MGKKSNSSRLAFRINTDSCFAIYFGIYAIVAVVGIYLSSYFRFASTAALSVVVEDGWCNSKEQGIGLHCFGDFYYNFGFVNLPNPWVGSPFPYPPLAAFIFKPFVFVYSLTPNSPWALCLYLLILVAAILFVPYSISKKFQLSHSNRFLLLTLTITSAPILVAIDRGNIILLTFPLLYLFIIAEMESKHRKAFTYWTFMILLKPHLVILGLLFFRNKQMRRGILNCFLAFGFFIGSFILYPVNIAENLKAYLHQLISYQEYVSSGSLYPVNVSLGNTVSLLTRFFFDTIPQASTLSCISAIFLILIGLKLYFSSNNLDIHTATMPVLAVILFPLVSFHYYLILLLPIFLIAVSLNLRGSEMRASNILAYLVSENENYLRKKGTRIIILLIILPIQIPITLFFKVSDLSANSAVSAHWILVQIGLVALSFYLIGRTREQRE